MPKLFVFKWDISIKCEKKSKTHVILTYIYRNIFGLLELRLFNRQRFWTALA